MTERKYFKPRSLTWWASVVPGLAGVFIAAEPLHGATAMVETVRTMAGGVPASVLINGALIGIGLRAAVGK